jgi:hypothetical protein
MKQELSFSAREFSKNKVSNNEEHDVDCEFSLPTWHCTKVPGTLVPASAIDLGVRKMTGQNLEARHP